MQSAAQGQNALLPETRGDWKPGPESAGWSRVQVSYSYITLPDNGMEQLDSTVRWM